MMLLACSQLSFQFLSIHIDALTCAEIAWFPIGLTSLDFSLRILEMDYSPTIHSTCKAKVSSHTDDSRFH
jgi:hypothetical protein